MTFEVHHGDCIKVMRGMDADSVDAIVTDPPYGLEFMGKDWDKLAATIEECKDFEDRPNPSCPFGGGGQRIRYGSSAKSMQVWHEVWAREALRVAKPGAHMLAFGGTRTYHRLMCAIEDAGWEIRDCIMWVYGQGFPKSLDVSKAIDKAVGVDTTDDDRWVRTPHPVTGEYNTASGNSKISQCKPGLRYLYTPKSSEAKRWDGWGTALKPAWEPIIVARKPLIGTVAANVLEHGTGGINVDGCRIPVDPNDPVKDAVWTGRPSAFRDDTCGFIATAKDGDRMTAASTIEKGRWPANLIHDGSDDVVAVFDRAGSLGSRGNRCATKPGGGGQSGFLGGLERRQAKEYPHLDSDAGGSAARFFYCAKADRKDRGRGNNHPTVKPTKLMRYLCRLVTPPDGLILDPFAGSGSTGKAAMLEGFRFVGIEEDGDYTEIALARIAWAEREWLRRTRYTRGMARYRRNRRS